jgi:hypothetical protein
MKHRVSGNAGNVFVGVIEARAWSPRPSVSARAAARLSARLQRGTVGPGQLTLRVAKRFPFR